MQVELGPKLGPISLAPIQILVVGTCLASGNGSSVLLLDIVEGQGCEVNGWVG